MNDDISQIIWDLLLIDCAEKERRTTIVVIERLWLELHKCTRILLLKQKLQHPRSSTDAVISCGPEPVYSCNWTPHVCYGVAPCMLLSQTWYWPIYHCDYIFPMSIWIVSKLGLNILNNCDAYIPCLCTSAQEYKRFWCHHCRLFPF